MSAGAAHAVAIVGIALRVPGANDHRTFWSNLVAGVESIETLTDEQLIAAGVSRDRYQRPDYVRRAAPMARMEWFDAEFFGFSPKDAAILDPQHRQFLATCWEALEDAAHPPSTFDGSIGVFGGCGMGAYLAFNLLSNQQLLDDVGLFLLRHTGNDKDFLVTRASYLLDLQGPAVNVQTACSTSLVATHLAAQSLLSGECDLALAGGVTIEIPHGRGYLYQAGEILSPDGRCRPFDSDAAGTVFGSGAGVVALRRLDDAIDDGDHIYAVLLGTAINNDGARKVGYLAPSVDGQAACIAEALAVAGVEPDSVQFIECHGTGTAMGDPIEVAALDQVLGRRSDGSSGCAIGSVKGNIGHLDTAAGVASLIKAALALRHEAIPPSLHFRRANPNSVLMESAMHVADQLQPWPREPGAPRRAGVNSLGVGGTNAFAVLTEAPPSESSPAEGPQLLVLSARSRAALDEMTERVASHLEGHPTSNLADVAYTLHAGRHQFNERRVVVARSTTDAARLLRDRTVGRVFTHTATSADPPIIFMFPGGGAQVARMIDGLYGAEPLFRAHIDEGLQQALAQGIDLSKWLLPRNGVDSPDDELQAASLQLPALLIVEHALAQLLISLGVKPAALAGHSVGETVAACISGTMTFAECLGLVACRGRLLDRCQGGMLAVHMSAAELLPLLDDHGLDLGVVNAPDLCVASGTHDRLASLARQLNSIGVEHTTVRINVAAHSRLLDPVLDEFRAHVRSIRLSPPTIPWVSNTTGTWITDEQATDPEYWVRQLRSTVDFAANIAEIAGQHRTATFVEVGPGSALTTLARLNPAVGATHGTVSTMDHTSSATNETTSLLTALGRLWALGADYPTSRAYSPGRRLRLSLPTYAFQEQRYFIEPSQLGRADAKPAVDRDPPEHWYWEETWVPQAVVRPTSTESQTYLVIADGLGIADAVVAELRAVGHRVAVVRSGDRYDVGEGDEFVLAPEHGRSGYEQLLSDLIRRGLVPDRVLHLALLADAPDFRPGSSFFHRNHELGFYSLVFLMQAWASEGLRRPLHLVVATTNAQQAAPGDAVSWPEQAMVLGPALVLPRELPGVTTAVLDVVLDPRRRGAPRQDGILAASLIAEVTAVADEDSGAVVAAIRDGERLVRSYRRVALAPTNKPFPLRDKGVVLITGGLGGIGLSVADELHQTSRARLVLLTRSTLPPAEQWDDLCSTLDPHHPLRARLQSLIDLQSAGADVTVVTGDVSNIARMSDIITALRDTHGGLHGIVHAAGTVDDRPLLQMEQADIEPVLAAKVVGTLVLDELTRELPLDFFVVFSSTSAITAPPGQLDYVAANAFLEAFTRSRQHRLTSIAWGPWAEVGMAVAAARRLGGDAGVGAQPCVSAMFTNRATDATGTVTLQAQWPHDVWFFDEHRTAAGAALFPGVGYIELARQALQEIGPLRPFELCDLVLLAPLAASIDEATAVRVVLRPTDFGYSMEVLRAATETRWVPTAQAQLVLRPVSTRTAADHHTLIAAATARSPLRTRQQDHLRLGPRWNVTERVAAGPQHSVAWLAVADEFIADLDDFLVHPAVVDIAVSHAIEQVPGYDGDALWVPISAQSVIVHDPAGPADQLARATSIASVRPGSGQDAGFASFDVAILGREGRPAISIEGFTMRRLDGPLDIAARPDEAIADSAQPRGTAASRASEVLVHNVEHGIRPAEGREAFVSAMRARAGGTLVISQFDPLVARAQIDTLADDRRSADGAGGVSFARPQLGTAFVGPRDALERTLAELWQELLGIDQVGIHDSFFDLGGHSLIAVRLFARIRKLFAVDLPISALFTAQTIASGAALIRSLLPTDGSVDDSATSPPRRYTYLVAMHSQVDADRAPFFLVAGMFGNVLNLRHLSHQVGNRPFYGVQARGVFGGVAPHETFEEMAAAYLAEVREVQPHGPYLLGGFSGGGVTALEMARQLRADDEEVALLIMLDTPAPTLRQPLSFADKAAIHFQDIARDGLHYPRRWWQRRQAWRHDVAARATQQTNDIEQAFLRALDRYQVGHYDGHITLYRPVHSVAYRLPRQRAIDVRRDFIEDDNGWRRHCDRVTVVAVPGDHDSMVLEPHVRVLADALRTELDRVDR